MRAFTTDEMTRLQAANEESMMDTCVIMTHSTLLDSYGADSQVFTDGLPTICNVDMTVVMENRKADMTVEKIDATIRLPIGTVIKPADRVRITARYGIAVMPIELEVVGAIRMHVTGLVVDLQAVHE
jgi:hypothetical protein